MMISALVAEEHFAWALNGIPIRQGVHIEWQRTADSGNEGELIFAWSDTRNGDRDVYMQKIDLAGNKLWGETGVQASVTWGRQEDPVIVSDGMGGAFLAWIDYRADEYGDVYGQYINSDGLLQWDPAGVPLAVNDGAQQTANMARGGEGYAFVIWDDWSQSEQGDIFGQVLSVSGPIEDPEHNGFPVADAAGSQSSHTIENSGSDAVVAWVDTRDPSNPDIYAQRLDNAFNKHWTDQGTLVCGEASEQSAPKVAPADGDRVVLSWLDPRNNDKGDVYSQILNVDGEAAWTANGIAVTNLSAEQNRPRVKSNGVDLLYYIWEDFRNNNQDPDIYTQALNFDGTPHWTADGIPVSTADLKQLQPRITVESSGGFFVVWLDERQGGFPQSDVYIQKVNDDASMDFIADGLALTDAKRYQTGGLVRPDGSGGAMVVWGNASTGSIGIMAQHVSSDGSQSWDADGTEYFFGIDGDASRGRALPWGDHEVMVFWEDNRLAATGAVATAQVISRNAGISHILDGKSLSTNDEQAVPVITPDHANGAYLGFMNKTTGIEILYAHRIDENLDAVWPSDGIRIYEESFGAQEAPFVVADGDGNLFYFWSELRFGPYTIYIQKFDPEGNAHWQADGVEIGGDMIYRDKYVTDAVLLADGGIFFVWEAISWDDVDVHVSKIDNDGVLQWSQPITEATGIQENPELAFDVTLDLAYIGWHDARQAATNGVDLYYRSVTSDGTLGEELTVVESSGDQTELALSLADDDSGVLYAAWEDYRDGLQHDIFVRELNSSSSEIQITTESSEDLAPALRVVSASHFFVVWEDFRNGIHSDLYFYDSEIGHEYNVPGGVPLCVDVLNQSDPQIAAYADNSPDSSAYIIVWEDMRSSGKTELTNIYAQGYIEGAVAIDDDEVTVQDFQVMPAFPNPFNGTTSIPVELNRPGMVKLTIHDLQGREIFSQSEYLSGNQTLQWIGHTDDLQELGSGVYIARIEFADQSLSQKLIYLR